MQLILQKGFDGSVIELAQKNKVPTLEVSHGTIAKNYNEFDYLYKKLIAESVLVVNQIILQSKAKFVKRVLKFFNQ